MNGAYAPPLTAPPAFADRQSRGDSKECCRPQYYQEGTEKVDNTACIWYNVYIKYRRCFYDRTTAEIGVKSIHGNI